MSPAPTVSLVMPVFNRAHLLDRVLEKLADNTTHPETELICVDDGSTDGSREILHRWRDGGRLPNMSLIEKPNAGAIDSLNRGLNAATGDFVVQLDDDVTLETPGWVERMLDLMQSDDSVGVVTGKVLFDDGLIQCCGVNVVGPAGWHERGAEPAERIGRRQWLGRMRPRPHEGEAGALESRAAEVDSGIGCCMMYRREAALEAGGYDLEWAPVWFDDVDLCIGIRRLGLKAFYVPDVRVIHYFTARRAPERRIERFTPRRLARALVRRTVGRLPPGALAVVERRVDLDLGMHFTRRQCALLRHHHAYWREKWGWSALNPDMDEIERRWGDTEIWWARDPERRAAGERIVEAYESRRGQPAVQGA